MPCRRWFEVLPRPISSSSSPPRPPQAAVAWGLANSDDWFAAMPVELAALDYPLGAHTGRVRHPALSGHLFLVATRRLGRDRGRHGFLSEGGEGSGRRGDPELGVSGRDDPAWNYPLRPPNALMLEEGFRRFYWRAELSLKPKFPLDDEETILPCGVGTPAGEANARKPDLVSSLRPLPSLCWASRVGIAQVSIQSVTTGRIAT